jgi:hypothetical protein
VPQLRKLAPEEVQALQNKGKGQRKLVEEQYDAFLGDYEIGEYGEAVLDEGENRLTVRNRLKAAATRRTVGLDFRRTTGDFLRFQVVEQSANGAAKPSRKAAEPTPPPPEPAKRKGGRPKKNSA